MPDRVIIFTRHRRRDAQSKSIRSISNFTVSHLSTPLSSDSIHQIGGFAPRPLEGLAHLGASPEWVPERTGSSFVLQNVEVGLKMSADRPRSISELLQTGDISRLKSEAADRRNLAARVRSELPEAEAEHVVSAHLDDQGLLVIGMDSPAWAARLRYSISELLGKRLKVRTAVPRGGDL